MNNDYPYNSVEEFPTELLLHMFSYASPKDLSSCIRVCTRWKALVETIFENDKYWRQHCLKDFGELAKNAHYKSQFGTTWRRIYRSMKLWPKLLHSQESRDEFANTVHEGDQIYGFQALHNSIVSVHTQKSIEYYYVKNLQPVDVPKVAGRYYKYMENEDTMVFQSIYFHLFIIRKYVTQKHFRHNITYDHVKLFKLINRSLYFVKMDNDLCLCDLNNSELSCSDLCNIPNILTITVRESNIYILTKMRDIYVYQIETQKLYIIENLENVSNPLNTLRKYGFLDDGLDQYSYFPWMNYRVFVTIRNKFIRDITCIQTYGDIVFVGTKYGIFRIYHINSNEDLSFLNKKPLKEYNFMNEGDLSVCIQQIDVVEGDDQHTVLVALENKIISLNFAHKFR